MGNALRYVGPVQRWSPLARRHGFDALIVLGAVAAALDVALRDDALRAPRTTPWFAVPAIVVLVAVLLGRRSLPFAAPVSVWLLAAALSFVDGRLVTFTFSAMAAGLVATFLLGNQRDALQGRAGLAIGLGAAAIVVFNDPNRTASSFVFILALISIAWLAGFALRERVVQAEAAEARALAAERERESAARVAVAEERARIARELHDVVAHAVSVMVLQVGAVRHRLPGTLADDREALQGVERAGRSALAEMRRLLGALHSGGEVAERTPQPGLDGLEALTEEVRRAGLPVRLHVEGEAVPLPRGIDLSAYRIVQEGLTNALRHARASHADVTVRYGADALRLEVRDDGVGASTSDGRGHGLVGIRERVKIYGGAMTAGAAPNGGFLLTALLPLERYRS